MKKITWLVAALVVAACGDGTGPGTETPGASLTIAEDSVALQAGGSRQLTVNAKGNAEFSTRDSTIARISATGMVTARAAGRTVVVGQLSNNGSVRDSVIVVVTPIIDPAQPTLFISVDSLAMTAGFNTQLTVTITDAAPNAVFVSRNETVARVSATGLVTAMAAGRAVVVASLASNTNIRDSVVVNVSPATFQIPVLGSGVVSERYTSEVAVAGNYAYTSTWGNRAAGGNAVKIWNVAGNTPQLVDSLIVSNAATTGDIQISDDGALLVVAIEFGSDDGIMIYDRSNPAKPVPIKRFTTAATRQGVHTVKLGRVNGRHYAFLALDPRSGQPAKLAIADITDPANPTEVFVQAMGNPFIHDVFVRDGVLFAALWHTGLTIFDIGGAGRGGTPSAPVQLGTVKTSPCSTCGSTTASVHNVWWFHDPTTGAKRYAFIGEEGPANLGGFQRASGALHVVDVSNFDAPREVAVYEPDSLTTASGKAAGAHNFAVDEPSGVLYAAFYNGGVRALDVRGDLSACTAAQKTGAFCDLRKMGREIGVALSSGPPKFVWGVALNGNHLYASDMPNGIHKLDVSALKR